MTVDERITAALRHDAPLPRDPLFRIQVLERAERQRFRRRSQRALAGGAAIGVVSALAAGGGAYTAGAVLLFALAFVTGAVVVMPEFGRLIRRLSI